MIGEPNTNIDKNLMVKSRAEPFPPNIDSVLSFGDLESQSLLERFNVLVSMVKMKSGGMEKILNVLARSPYHPIENKVFRVNVSTVENPRIIFEHGASNCSILIGVDLMGNIISVHDIFSTNERLIAEDLAEDGFSEKLGLFGKEKLFFLTGTNILDKHRLKMIASLAKVLDTKIITYLIDEKLMEESGWVDDVLILPKYFSKQGKVEFLIPNLGNFELS